MSVSSKNAVQSGCTVQSFVYSLTKKRSMRACTFPVNLLTTESSFYLAHGRRNWQLSGAAILVAKMFFYSPWQSKWHITSCYICRNWATPGQIMEKEYPQILFFFRQWNHVRPKLVLKSSWLNENVCTFYAGWLMVSQRQIRLRIPFVFFLAVKNFLVFFFLTFAYPMPVPKNCLIFTGCNLE